MMAGEEEEKRVGWRKRGVRERERGGGKVDEGGKRVRISTVGLRVLYQWLGWCYVCRWGS